MEQDKYKALVNKCSEKKFGSKETSYLQDLIPRDTVIHVSRVEAREGLAPKNDTNGESTYYSNQIGEVNDEKLKSNCQKNILHLNNSFDKENFSGGCGLLDSQISFKTKKPLHSEKVSDAPENPKTGRSVDSKKFKKNKPNSRSLLATSQKTFSTAKSDKSSSSKLNVFNDKITKGWLFIKKMRKWFSVEVQNYVTHKHTQSPNVISLYREANARFKTFLAQVELGKKRVKSLLQSKRGLGREDLTKDFGPDCEFIINNIEAILKELSVQDPYSKFVHCVEQDVNAY